MTDLLSIEPRILQTAITLTITTALLALSDRRLLVVPLALQYVLVASLVGPLIGLPLFGIRLTLGVAITAIMYITATSMESPLRRRPAAGQTQGAVAASAPQMGPVYRLLTLGLAALLAAGFWSGSPLPDLPSAVVLCALWLVAVGASVILASTDPLRMGIGLLVFINSLEALYLTLESSLLVVALTGLLDILVALAIAYASESWLVARRGEAAGR
jgi:hypothetical protein